MAGKKAPGPGALVVDTATVAKYLGVAERTVRNYARNEGMPKVRQNRFDLVEVRKWELIRLKKEIAEQQVDDKRYKRAAADDKEQGAKLKKMRGERMEGLLIDRGEAERGLLARIGAVTSGLGMLAQRIAGRIKGEGVEDIVNEEVSLCRQRFASEEEFEMVEKKKNFTTENTENAEKKRKKSKRRN